MMKNLIRLGSIFLFHLCVQAQNGLLQHNTCVTGKQVCNEALITESFKPIEECEGMLTPQYFNLYYESAGSFTLDTWEHTGTYTLYGPMSSFGITACEQISLGQVNQVSGSLSGVISLSHGAGFYILQVNVANCIRIGLDWGVSLYVSARQSSCTLNPDCADCIGSFSPDPGKYILSAWTKGEYENRNNGYENPGIAVSFVGASESSYFIPSGMVIDGWQRIDGIVTVPPTATDIKIGLYCETGACFFDDIRFVPINGSMVSYVYDPVTLKLVAQLDERNYSSLYEYDEEGKLVRTKKETEKGIMTIQENRDNIHKR